VQCGTGKEGLIKMPKRLYRGSNRLFGGSTEPRQGSAKPYSPIPSHAPCSKMMEVMAGLDFNATSGWAWVLPASLLEDATEASVWAGEGLRLMRCTSLQ